MDWRAGFGVFRVTGIDIIGARPGRSGMRMGAVEIAGTVDVHPGIERPSHRPWRLPELRQGPARRLVGHLVHVADQAPPGVTAEFELPGLGMPAADIGLLLASARPLMRKDAG